MPHGRVLPFTVTKMRPFIFLKETTERIFVNGDYILVGKREKSWL